MRRITPSFLDTSHADVTTHVVAVCRVADLYAILAAGMDEDEGVVDGVVIHDDAHMTYVTPRIRTGEEHEVARLHLITANGDVTGILVTRRAADNDVVLAIDIAGKARAVEGVGSLAAAAVAGTKVRDGLTEDVVRRGEIDVGIVGVGIEEVEVVDFLVCLYAVYFLGLFLLALG